jgi:hypothetical protein|tara:strand:+ start:1921 stop:2148 length:228 start_codon:yes stop_codon:yes gene_type:complete
MSNEIAVMTGEQVLNARLLTLKTGLKIETLGLRLTSRQRSCYSIIKEEFGLKGNKKRVLEQFENLLKLKFQTEEK